MFEVFHAFTDELRSQKQFKQMKTIGSYVFLKNHIAKCFRVLKYYTFLRKHKKNAPIVYRLKSEQKVFRNFKARTYRKVTCKKVVAQKKINLIEQVFGTFKSKYLNR